MSLNADISLAPSEQRNSEDKGLPETILQVNTETLQRYAELMGMFYIENARWLQAIYENCYEGGWDRRKYLLRIYNLIGWKVVSQTDYEFGNIPQVRLARMLVIQEHILIENPNISKEECIHLCEIKFKQYNLSPEEITLAKEIISTVFDRIPNKFKK